MNTLSSSIQAFRSDKLADLIKQHGNQKAFVHKHGLSQSHISNLLHGWSSFGEKTARNLELKTGLTFGFFDDGFDASSANLKIKPGRKSADYHKSHRLVQIAIRDGYLPKPSTLLCQDCGQPAQVYDHRDYNRPLDVEPVCHACNVKRGPAVPFVHVNDR